MLNNVFKFTSRNENIFVTYVYSMVVADFVWRLNVSLESRKHDKGYHYIFKALEIIMCRHSHTLQFLSLEVKTTRYTLRFTARRENVTYVSVRSWDFLMYGTSVFLSKPWKVIGHKHSLKVIITLSKPVENIMVGQIER